MNDNNQEYLFRETLDAETVRAQRYEVVDADGTARLKLYTAADGTPCFVLLNPDQDVRVTISLDDNERGWIGFFGKKGFKMRPVIHSRPFPYFFK